MTPTARSSRMMKIDELLRASTIITGQLQYNPMWHHITLFCEAAVADPVKLQA